MIELSFEGVGTQTLSLPSRYIEFAISNDGVDDLHFTINGIEIEVKSGESFEEAFPPFNKVLIVTTTTNPWRAYVSEIVSASPVIPSDNSRVSKALLLVRYDIDDMQKIKVSDFQLLNYLNTVLRFVNLALCNIDSSYVLAKNTVPVDSGVGILPKDFHAVVSVSIKDTATAREMGLSVCPISITPTKDNYKIMGNMLFTDNESVELTYKRKFPTVNLDGILPVEDAFLDLIVKYVVSLVGGGKDDLLPMIEKEVYSLMHNREITHIERDVPFVI